MPYFGFCSRKLFNEPPPIHKIISPAAIRNVRCPKVTFLSPPPSQLFLLRFVAVYWYFKSQGEALVFSYSRSVRPSPPFLSWRPSPLCFSSQQQLRRPILTHWVFHLDWTRKPTGTLWILCLLVFTKGTFFDSHALCFAVLPLFLSASLPLLLFPHHVAIIRCSLFSPSGRRPTCKWGNPRSALYLVWSDFCPSPSPSPSKAIDFTLLREIFGEEWGWSCCCGARRGSNGSRNWSRNG